MCNVYEPPKAERLVSVFDAQLPLAAYLPVIAPLRPGPFVTSAAAVTVGQWGMIPPNSKSRLPSTSKGGRMSTNNARREGMAKSWTFGQAWHRSQRCLIPAESYDEPYWGTGKNIWWRFWRADAEPWALAGLWDEWTDPETGEVVANYTMITQNCDAHPLLALMHKPELDANKMPLPADRQDKRAVVPIERDCWDEWLNGTPSQAETLIQVPAIEVFRHGAADPAQNVELRGVPGQMPVSAFKLF
jgi:putative SOS response-associated peptidase YedK